MFTFLPVCFLAIRSLTRFRIAFNSSLVWSCRWVRSNLSSSKKDSLKILLKLWNSNSKKREIRVKNLTKMTDSPFSDYIIVITENFLENWHFWFFENHWLFDNWNFGQHLNSRKGEKIIFHHSLYNRLKFFYHLWSSIAFSWSFSPTKWSTLSNFRRSASTFFLISLPPPR